MAGGLTTFPGQGVASLAEPLDEFKCHPNNMNYLRSTYQGILTELADSNVGQQVIREVCSDEDYVLEKFSENLGDEIIKSEYFLS
jgi:hypothetical protein